MRQVININNVEINLFDNGLVNIEMVDIIIGNDNYVEIIEQLDENDYNEGYEIISVVHRDVWVNTCPI